jgi:hypothetical protein
MGIHRSFTRGRTCTHSGVCLVDKDTRVAPPHFLIDGDPLQNDAMTALGLGVALLRTTNLHARDSVKLTLHPFQHASDFLAYTRSPDHGEQLILCLPVLFLRPNLFSPAFDCN